jgi:hypothetical protein
LLAVALLAVSLLAVALLTVALLTVALLAVALLTVALLAVALLTVALLTVALLLALTVARAALAALGPGAVPVLERVRAVSAPSALSVLSVSAEPAEPDRWRRGRSAAADPDALALLAVLEPAADAGADAAPPPCRSLMASISCPLRIRAVPLMPRSAATACSSGSTMPESPPLRRLALLAVEAASVAWSPDAPADRSVGTSRTSVVSDTLGPSSFERCHGGRPVATGRACSRL